MTIRPSSKRALDLAALAPAIRDAGFKPGEMWVRGTGSIERDRDHAHVRLRGWQRTFPVRGEGVPRDVETPFVARVDYSAQPPVFVLDEKLPGFARD